MTEQEARKLEVPLEWNGKANVCTYCGRVPETFYVVIGHDDTDDSIHWCICRDGTQYKSEIESLRQQLADLTNVHNQTVSNGIAGFEAIKQQLAECQAEMTAYKRATDLAYKGSELETRQQLAECQALALPDNSTEILQEWKDKQFGEPVGFVVIHRDDFLEAAEKAIHGHRETLEMLMERNTWIPAPSKPEIKK